jgi:ferredoxin-NADP reductase
MRAANAWLEARIEATREVARDIRLLEIRPAHGAVPWGPGSNLNVTVMAGGRPDTRSYSLVGEPDPDVYRITVKRLPESRGGSAYMWSLAPGARLRITQPKNHFELAFGRPDYLLIAGGIGITPIYGMALALARRGARFRLLYAARGRADLAFAPELEAQLGDRLELFVSDEGRRIDVMAEIQHLTPGGELYVCGPIPLLNDAKRAWAASGRRMGGLRFETFGNSGLYAPEPFVVRIPRLGLTVRVPENQSMLDALEQAGVEMIHDCRRGECGLCAVDIVEAEGVVDHRDVFFSEEQKARNRKLCTCVSRAVRGGITIDTADR